MMLQTFKSKVYLYAYCTKRFIALFAYRFFDSANGFDMEFSEKTPPSFL